MHRSGSFFSDCAVLWLRLPGPLPSKSGHMFMKQAVAGSIPGFLTKGNVPHFQRLHWLQTVDVVDAGPVGPFSSVGHSWQILLAASIRGKF